MWRQYLIFGLIAIVTLLSSRYLFSLQAPAEQQVVFDNELPSGKDFTASVSDKIEFDTETGDEIFAEEIKYPPITWDEEADKYIRALAEKRGYKFQAVAKEEALIPVFWYRLMPEVATNFLAMQAEMAELGMDLTLVSGYRSPEWQREIFLRKLGGFTIEQILAGELDAKIDEVLSSSSIPGYSKHHSGEAIDFGCGNYILSNAFVWTECYKWLSENDFANAEKYNFHPSYPFGVAEQGPNPEPWEFVWGAI